MSIRYVYIECGTAMNSPYNTGIQRVVRSIVRESEFVGKQLGVECVPVWFLGNEFHREIAVGGKGSSLTVRCLHYCLRGGIRLYRILCRVLSSKLDVKIRSLFRSYVTNIYNKSTLENVRNSSTTTPFVQETPVSESPNILLLLDSTWNNDMWPAVDQFRAAGGHVCAVLYDLIPFTYPETVEEHTRQAHTSWWLNVPKHVDSVMCISNTVRNQFLEWQENNTQGHCIPSGKVGFFYLGSDICADEDEALSLPCLEVLDSPYFLVVGSIEPRKNHRVILDAFDLLWQQGVTANLVIVGGHGWKSEDFLRRTEKHSMLNKHLFILNRVTDSELSSLYSKSASLIFASLEEGFGLPIVESYKRGVNVICSDIPVFREVARERATYFDPFSPESLANVIRRQLNGALSPSSISESNPCCITWEQSTAQLLSRGLLLADSSNGKIALQ